MNTFRITLALICVVASQPACGTSDASVPKLTGEVATQDEPVDVVKRLWSAGAEGDTDARNRLMSFTPGSFYDEECVVEEKKQKDGSTEVNARSIATPRKDWLYDSTLKTLDEITPKKFRLDEVSLERIRGGEAIVRILYYNPADNFIIETFTLLHRESDGWKVFAIGGNLEMLNAHYAADRCQPAPKLTNSFEEMLKKQSKNHGQ